MSTCARCGHELGVGRFCTNCGHPIGQPVPESEVLPRLDVPTPGVTHDESTDRPAWLLPVIGAVLALVLVVALVSCLGGDEDEPDAARSTPTADASGAAGDRLRPTDVARTARIDAPEAAPTTTDLDGSTVGFPAEQMVDGLPETSWRTAGDATGTTITFTLRRPTTLTSLGLVNGYARRVSNGSSQVDWYPLNRRITRVLWVFDDGSTVGQDLSEVRRLQRLRIDPVTTRTVQLRIAAVTPPGAGPLGRDYTAVSEVLLSGTRA
ncbi:NADase-type glycan-binding domain-containing protein [Nocardioides sp. P5_C9_2]